jgi:hypothetical protein
MSMRTKQHREALAELERRLVELQTIVAGLGEEIRREGLDSLAFQHVDRAHGALGDALNTVRAERDGLTR